jgi:hypothetical protein
MGETPNRIVRGIGNSLTGAVLLRNPMKDPCGSLLVGLRSEVSKSDASHGD